MNSNRQKNILILVILVATGILICAHAQDAVTYQFDTSPLKQLAVGPLEYADGGTIRTMTTFGITAPTPVMQTLALSNHTTEIAFSNLAPHVSYLVERADGLIASRWIILNRLTAMGLSCNWQYTASSMRNRSVYRIVLEQPISPVSISPTNVEINGAARQEIFTAAGGMQGYQWSMSHPSIGMLSASTGTTVIYTSIQRGTNMLSVTDRRSDAEATIVQDW